MWKIRAEIIGDFVMVEEYDNKSQAMAEAEKLELMGIWDSVECWEIDRKEA